jgi:hypothetical protein
MDHGHFVADISQEVPEPIGSMLGARKYKDGVLVLSQQRHEQIRLAVVSRMMQALGDPDSRRRRA